jgi:hypothetical protein
VGSFNPLNRVGTHLVVAGDMEHLAVVPKDKCGDSAAQRDSVPRNGVEDGLGVCRRTAYYAQDLRCRRLLLPRLRLALQGLL